MSGWFFVSLFFLTTTVFFVVVAKRFIKRTLEFDFMFSELQNDITFNLENFELMAENSMLKEMPQLAGAVKLMKSMEDKLREYSLRIGDGTFPIIEKDSKELWARSHNDSGG